MNFQEIEAVADMDADHSRGTPKPPLPLSPCSSLTPGKLASHLGYHTQLSVRLSWFSICWERVINAGGVQGGLMRAV